MGEARGGGRGGDGDTFFGCNFLSAPATKRFDQSLNHPPPPPTTPYIARLSRAVHPSPPWNPSAPVGTPRVGRALYSCPLLRPPLALFSLPPPSTNLATVSVLNHICDAFFFPSSFFIKLDYNCIASSSCGIAGRKNGTLAGGRWGGGGGGEREGAWGYGARRFGGPTARTRIARRLDGERQVYAGGRKKIAEKEREREEGDV